MRDELTIRSRDDTVDSLMRRCLENDFSSVRVLEKKNYSKPMTARKLRRLQQRTDNGGALSESPIEVLDKLIEALYLTQRDENEYDDDIDLIEEHWRAAHSPSSSARSERTTYSQTSKKRPDDLLLTSRSGLQKVQQRPKSASARLTSSRSLPSSSRVSSAGFSARSPSMSASARTHKEQVKTKKRRKKKQPTVTEVKRDSSEKSYMYQTVWDLLKLGSIKRQQMIEAKIREGKPLDPEYLDNKSIVNQFHEYLQRCVKQSKPTPHFDIKKLIKEAFKKKDKQDMENFEREHEALRGLFRHRENISRHQYKALIRNIQPHKFSDGNTGKKKKSSHRSESSLSDYTDPLDELDIYEHVKEEVKQDEGLKTHRQTLFEITKKLAEPEQLDELDLELFSDLDGFHSYTNPADRKVSFLKIARQSAEFAARPSSKLSNSNSTDKKLSKPKDKVQKPETREPTPLNDKSVPSFVAAWYHKGAQEVEKEEHEDEEETKQASNLIATTISETKLKLFEPYSSARKRSSSYTEMTTEKQPPPNRKRPAVNKHPLSKTTSKGRSLVIAFQQMVLPKDVSVEPASTQGSAKGADGDVESPNPFDLMNSFSEESERHPKNQHKKHAKSRPTTPTSTRRRQKMKAPLDTGSGFKKRNSYIEIGKIPPKSSTISAI